MKHKRVGQKPTSVRTNEKQSLEGKPVGQGRSVRPRRGGQGAKPQSYRQGEPEAVLSVPPTLSPGPKIEKGAKRLSKAEVGTA